MFVAFASLGSLAAPARAQFAFEVVDGLTPDHATLSRDGQTVAGSALNINGVTEPALWTRATGAVRLGSLPRSTTSFSFGISDGRAVVGSARSDSRSEAFLWTPARGIVSLGDLSGVGVGASAALDVSADGQVVVGSSGSTAALDAQAFRWTAATGMISLGDLPGGASTSMAAAISPDGNTIVGSSHSAAGEEAFLWTAATGMVGLGDLPGGGGVTSRALAVSADGDVVVGMGVSDQGFEAFRWTRAGGMVGLGSLDPLDFASMAQVVSADGNVIAGTGSGAADFFGHAFVWFPATGMIHLQNYLLANGVTAVQGWRFSGVTGISADGRVLVGTGIDPQGRGRLWIAQIEPDRRPAPVPTPVPAPAPDGPETVAPASLSIGAGLLIAGGTTQLAGSDDSYLRLRETARRTIQVTIAGRVARGAARELRFAVEAAAVGSATRQQVALFDVAARQWVTVSDAAATAGDASVEIRITDRPGRFIDPATLRVQARLTFTPSGARRVTTDVRVDRAGWTRIP